MATRKAAVRVSGECTGMFFFFSNQFGCIGSILISVVLSLALFFILRGCMAH